MAWRTGVCLVLLPLALLATPPGTSNTGSGSPSTEYIPEYTDEFLHNRLDELHTVIPMVHRREVRDFIRYYTIVRRDYIREVQRLSTVYFPVFDDYLARYQLPNELKYLSIVESGLRAHAISPSGAGGLWQFMPKTGVIFGLQRGRYTDERRDYMAATDAACRYLTKLHARFNDWFLALAAFNAGEGRVSAAIRRSGQRSYWQLRRYLPRETRSYVPQFIALVYVMNYAHLHNIFPQRHSYLPPAVTVSVEAPLHLPTVAKMLGGRQEELLLLNPQYYRDIVPPGTQNLRIPRHHAEAYRKHGAVIFVEARKQAAIRMRALEARQATHHASRSRRGRHKVVYRVRRGDALSTIAQRYGVRVSDLKRWNRLRSSHMIRAGRKLVLWTSNPPRSKRTITPTDDRSSLRGYYVVQPGDSLWSISRRYEHLTASKLKRINNLRSNLIKPGQRLRIHRD